MKVNRESSRLISMKVNMDRCLLNIVYAYAPQVGYDEEKKDFWSLLENIMLQVLDTEVLWIRADFNGHMGEENSRAQEMMG